LSAGSPASDLIDRLVRAHGKEAAHRILDVILDKFTVVELAALAYDWSDFWARPKQKPPDTDWSSFGFLTGRGFGKTIAVAKDIVKDIEAGILTCGGLAAQNEDKTLSVQVAALQEASPPWFKPEWVATTGTLTWPNGATATAFTPESPGNIRAPNFDWCWLSEIQSWPAKTRQEALLNFEFATRKGVARMYWDATPKRGHPILKALLKLAEEDPADNIVVRGSIHENSRNLAPKVITKLVKKYDGTTAGEEEIWGRMVEDSESATTKQIYIDDNRRDAPASYAYSAISIDCAVTSNQGSDKSGIVRGGVDAAGQAYVAEDRSDKHTPEAWATIAIDDYIKHKLDLMILETNKGGDLVVQNIRAAADKRKIKVVVVAKDEKPKHTPGTIWIKTVYAKGAKQDRAQPVGIAYKRGRISHVNGADLAQLEETVTTWEPTEGARSPDDLDALVHLIVELLDLSMNEDAEDPHAGFEGITQAAQALHTTQVLKMVNAVGAGSDPSTLARLLGGSGRRGI